MSNLNPLDNTLPNITLHSNETSQANGAKEDIENRHNERDHEPTPFRPGNSNGNNNNNSLQVPLNPQPRRKRGLSLRSQLFNKAFNIQEDTPPPPPLLLLLEPQQSKTSSSNTQGPVSAPAPAPSSSSSSFQNPQLSHQQNYQIPLSGSTTTTFEPQKGIELQDIPKNQIHSPQPPPLINIDEAPELFSPINPTAVKGAHYDPYNSLLDAHLTKSSSHLTMDSMRTSNSTNSFIAKRQRLHGVPKNKFLTQLKELKNKLLGIKSLPNTETGRIIPLSINPESVNSYYQDEYYSTKFKGYIDERTNHTYINNLITSSKYTVYSFLPKQLKAQFSKVANCYFMVVAIMQMIPGWSTTGHYTTIIPLCIFMSISIAREGFDDWKRHGHDKEENNKLTTVIKEDLEMSSFDTHSINTILTETIPVNNSRMNLNGKTQLLSVQNIASNNSSLSDMEDSLTNENLAFTNKHALKRYNLKEISTKWKNVKVGDIVKVNEDEWFPADMILIATSNNDTQEAFVETMALDGETNLKSKVPHKDLSDRASTVPGLKTLHALVTTEDPNIDLYNFDASFSMHDMTFPLGSENVVYRGSILRNTKAVLGLVVFTGEETKVRMNNLKNPRTKAPKLQKNINYIVIFMVFVVIMLAAFSTMAQRLEYFSNRDGAWYLYNQDAGVAATLMGFIIMYNTLIPLSLYVTMEIIKVMQLCFLQFDIDMYHKESNTPADAKTATILEELGQVSYIFSDKTGTLTDNKMVFRKMSVCGVSFLHDLDLLLTERSNPEENNGIDKLVPRTSMHIPQSSTKKQANPESIEIGYNPRISTTSLARESMDVRQSGVSTKTWVSTAQPRKLQDATNSLHLLRYVQSHPQTLFAKKAKFFLLCLALCNTCLPRKKDKNKCKDGSSTSSLDDEEVEKDMGSVGDNDNNNNNGNNNENDDDNNNGHDDASITYQAASPDELALVQAARDLGYVMFDKRSEKLTVKTYPHGFDNDPVFEEYKVLDVIEFSSARKRMSIVIKFPDGRICVICKGADNIILEKLKNAKMAKQKAMEISVQTTERKMEEQDVILQSRFSQDIESRKSGLSFRKSLNIGGGAGGAGGAGTSANFGAGAGAGGNFVHGNPSGTNRVNTIDSALMGAEEEEREVAMIAEKARKSLHIQQARKYTFEMNEDEGGARNSTNGYDKQQTHSGSALRLIPNDKLLVNEEFLIEKTLEHIEEFSTEGLRTLLYSFRWLDKNEYESWHSEYANAKAALSERTKLVEEVGSKIECNLELVGATAIEDKLQEGVSEAIVKLRRAGIKLWMLTGDKRETAINIGYSCRLIKDYSTLVVLTNDEGMQKICENIKSTLRDLEGGRIAHCVLVIDGATLGDVEADQDLFAYFLELCVQVDSTICCRASPSQKANMVSAVRKLKKSAVTLAIGDGANDIAMIQSADIGVGITGKEGLQAARSADYAIAQFRYLLKLLLVNGRYNYVRTSKFVLCTFYKELLFYLTQCVYQRSTLFSGSSMYESWSLSMFNTLFTSLPVICIGMFDKDLKPATLLAVPELYAKGRLYQAFNLRIFISWMVLATLQSVGVTFMAFYCWGFTALRDNTTFAFGSLMFAVMIILINAKCTLLEMQNRQWLAFASFIISVGGFGLWNVLIMALYKLKQSTIYFVADGLYEWGRDQSWWASLLIFSFVPLLFDIFIKIFKFMFKPSDDEIFKVYEQDMELRRIFETAAYKELCQSWTWPRDPSTTKALLRKILVKIGILRDKQSTEKENPSADIELSNYSNYEPHLDILSSINRKRAGTNQLDHELPPSSDGSKIYGDDFARTSDDKYETLPSGKRIKIKQRNRKWSLSRALRKRGSANGDDDDDDDVDAIIDVRLKNLREEEEGH